MVVPLYSSVLPTVPGTLCSAPLLGPVCVGYVGTNAVDRFQGTQRVSCLLLLFLRLGRVSRCRQPSVAASCTACPTPRWTRPAALGSYRASGARKGQNRCGVEWIVRWRADFLDGVVDWLLAGSPIPWGEGHLKDGLAAGGASASRVVVHRVCILRRVMQWPRRLRSLVSRAG
jgi:hypothetical protein